MHQNEGWELLDSQVENSAESLVLFGYCSIFNPAIFCADMQKLTVSSESKSQFRVASNATVGQEIHPPNRTLTWTEPRQFLTSGTLCYKRRSTVIVNGKSNSVRICAPDTR